MVTTCINNLSERYAFFLFSFPGKSSKLMQIKLIGKTYICGTKRCREGGAYNDRNGPERTGTDRNGQEWTHITGTDLKIHPKIHVLSVLDKKFQSV